MNHAKQIYTKMGLPINEIESRMNKINWLQSSLPERSHEGNAGGKLLSQGLGPVLFCDRQEVKEGLAPFVAKMAHDADAYAFNIPSSGIPAVFTTIWTTRMVEQLYKAMTLHKLAGSWQQGAPGVQNVMIPTIGYNGSVEPYSDFSMNGNTSINTDWVNKPIAYFQQALTWGDMQQAQYGLAKIDYVARMREAMAIAVAQFQNDIGFNGYTGIPSGNQPFISGILNDPGLQPAITLPADGQIPGTLTPTTSWNGKDFNQIVRDFRLFVNAVFAQSAGNVDLQTRGVFALPPSVYASLTTPNPISSVSVAQYLKEVFPNIELVQCPNFEALMNTTAVTPNQTVGMLILDHPNGEKAFDELFVIKWQGHRPVPMASSVSEKISYGLGGAFLKYPFLVSYAFGI